MTKKSWSLIILALGLFASYAYWFTPWINTPKIEIIKSDRLMRSGRPNAEVYPVAFTLDGKYALTSIRVVRMADVALKKVPPPLWHLVAGKHPEPTKGFIYGRPVAGMQPAQKNFAPFPLEPEVPYRLYVEAGRAKGEIDFRARPIDADAP